MVEWVGGSLNVVIIERSCVQSRPRLRRCALKKILYEPLILMHAGDRNALCHQHPKAALNEVVKPKTVKL